MTINITIDNKSFAAEMGQTIIEVADREGIYIPRFCYHPKLSIAANCRMCLVEVENAPKPLPSCATPVADGMKVFTRSKVALQAQKDIMSFLLINHPLDCPICDQGGECELQDLAMAYGKTQGGYDLTKRAVIDEDLGPLVATEMTRCIHCTRCVRFTEEVAGDPELGVMSRGGKAYIGTYLGTKMKSELSGNVIDLCPVGALTSKVSRYKGRSWSYRQHAQIARHDCIGSNVYAHVHSKNLDNTYEIMRTLPKLNSAINETWLSDRDRFSYQALSNNRVKYPEAKINGKWKRVTWQTAFDIISDKLAAVIKKQGADSVAGIISPNATLEEGYLMRMWLNSLGVNHFDYRIRHIDDCQFLQDRVTNDFTVPLQEIEQSNTLLLLDAYPRRNQPMLNHRIRKASQSGAFVGSIGYKSQKANYAINAEVKTNDLLYYIAGLVKEVISIIPDSDSLKPLMQSLDDIEVSDKQKLIAAQLIKDKDAIIILGEVALRHNNAQQIYAWVQCLSNLCNAKLQVITEGSNSAGMNIINKLKPCKSDGKAKHAYIIHDISINNDFMDTKLMQSNLAKSAFNVCVSSFKEKDAYKWADVILPATSIYETSGTVVNCQGDWQSMAPAILPSNETKPGWKIYASLLAWLNTDDANKYETCSDVTTEIKQNYNNLKTENNNAIVIPMAVNKLNETQVIVDWHDYRIDNVVRNSQALTKSIDQLKDAKCNTKFIDSMQIKNKIKLSQGTNSLIFNVSVDDNIADNTIMLPAGLDDSSLTGIINGNVQVEVA